MMRCCVTQILVYLLCQGIAWKVNKREEEARFCLRREKGSRKVSI